MVTVVQKDEIIKRYLQNQSKLEISKALNISWNTVSKYVEEYLKHQEELLLAETEEEKEAIIVMSNSAPSYDVSNRRKRKMTSDVTVGIDKLLEINEERRSQKLYKQLLNKTEIHRELRKQGHDVSYRSVSNYIALKEDKAKEAYIKSDYTPGYAAEFDWGDVSLVIDEIDGELRRYKLGVFALKYSSKVYSELYLNENKESFKDIHANYFESLDGVPHQITYDNARVQVKKFVGREKEPTDTILKLTNYYGYKHRFANVYSGNEKGTVERFVKVVRERAFAKNIHFETLQDARNALRLAIEELNQEQKQLKNKSVDELYKEERVYFLDKRIKLDVGSFQECKVNKYSFIYVDSVFYSVPDYLVGKTLTVMKYPTYIRVIYNNQHILKIERLYKKNNYKININHYIDTFKKKPGAIASSLALKQAKPWLQNKYQLYFSTNGKDFIEFMQLVNEHSKTRIDYIIDKLERNSISISISSIKFELDDQVITPVYEKINIDSHCESQLNMFNDLLKIGGEASVIN